MSRFASTAVCSFEQLETRAMMSATISGSVMQDMTGNGLTRDDRNLTGVTVRLHKDLNGNGRLDGSDGAAIASKTTGSNGKFAFGGLSTGKYLVKDVVPANQVRTGPALSDTIAINVTNGNKTYGNHKFANYVKTFDRSALSNIYYMINGKTKVTNLTGVVKEGDTVTAHFTVAAGKKVQLSLVSYRAIAPYSNAQNLQFQDIADLRTGVFGAGSHCMTVKVPKCYFQVDFVGGAAIDPFGPAGSNILYGAQGRLIGFANGGTRPCTPCDPIPNCGDRDRDRDDKCEKDKKDKKDKDRCDREDKEKKDNDRCDRDDRKDDDKDRKDKDRDDDDDDKCEVVKRKKTKKGGGC